MDKVSSRPADDGLTMKTNIRPQTIMQSQNNSLTKSASQAMNYSGKAIKSNVARKVKQETKKDLFWDNNLTGNDTSRDTGRAIIQTQELDLATCTNTKDLTDDYLGVWCGQTVGGDINAKLGKKLVTLRVALFKNECETVP